MGGDDPTYDLELWETGGGSALATLASGVTLSSDTGTVVSVTWDASSLGTADGSAVELRIVGTASMGTARAVEVGAVEWISRAADEELYFLRARYYDPETGRFTGRDVVEHAQRYAFAGSNPVRFADPNGLCRNPIGEEDEDEDDRPWWRRGLDAVDCVHDAMTTTEEVISVVTNPLLKGYEELVVEPVIDIVREPLVDVAKYCAQDWRVLPLFGECYERFEFVVIGGAVVVAGTGLGVLGCTAAVATGPWAPLVCGTALVGTAAGYTAGGVLIYQGLFGEFHHGDAHGASLAGSGGKE